MASAVMPVTVFIHGLEGSSQGAKAAFFREKYPAMIVEDYFGDFPERMAKLETILDDKSNAVLVGSSLGGLMAAYFACGQPEKIRKLVLLAPALNFLPPDRCRDRKLDFPVIIYHGSRDDVVPPEPVRKIAAEIFTNLTWRLVEDDHSLYQTFFTLDWDGLLA